MIKQSMDGEIPEAKDLRYVIKVIQMTHMTPRGSPYTEEMCKDLEKHFLHQFAPNRGPLDVPKDTIDRQPVHEDNVADRIVQSELDWQKL
jgi:hypothetical protein